MDNDSRSYRRLGHGGVPVGNRAPTAKAGLVWQQRYMRLNIKLLFFNISMYLKNSLARILN